MHPHLNALLELQRALPPESASLSERKRFYAEQRSRLSQYCRELGVDGRSETLRALAEYRALARPAPFRFMDSVSVKIDAATVEALAAVQGYLEASYEEPSHEETLHEAEALRTWDADKAPLPGNGAMHPALLRSAAFTDTSQERIFEVLGFTGTTIERESTKPLSLAHLHALVYAISKVKGWGDNGTTVEVEVWEALKTMGKATNKQSAQALLETYEDLQTTRIRMLHGTPDGAGESAPIVGKVKYNDPTKTHLGWKVQLTSTLLDAIAERYPTFLRLDTMAALPNGGCTWLYGFIASEAHEHSTWDEDKLATMAGLTSGSKYKRREKLREFLDTLVAGEVKVKARGKATHSEEHGELAWSKNGQISVRATTTKVKTFEPVLHGFRFIKTSKGKSRVELHKVMPKKEAAEA